MGSVEFERVEKVYPGGARALAPLDLRIGDGERMAVVGPSGCGKSTVLRLLAGLESPSGGWLRIDGRVVNELSPQERNVAMVFQDYALYPHMTVRDNLAFPLRMRRLPRAETRQRVERVAATLDLSGLLDRLPRQLSGGQRQRVAMGRALVRDPSVFLLDEPLSNLDAKLRGQVRAEIAELQRRTATTMLYVTHDQAEAMTLGDRVAVLAGGVLQQVGTPREIYEQPANRFVAGFVGSPPMNLLPAHLEPDGTGVVLVVAAQRLHFPVSTFASRSASDAVDLTLGIRPESLQLAPTGPGDPRLRAVVEQSEWLGHETLLHLRLATDASPLRLVARLAGMPSLPRGETLDLWLPPAAIHLFDRDGRAL